MRRVRPAAPPSARRAGWPPGGGRRAPPCPDPRTGRPARHAPLARARSGRRECTLTYIYGYPTVDRSASSPAAGAFDMNTRIRVTAAVVSALLVTATGQAGHAAAAPADEWARVQDILS